jgi:hypothetical protein
MSSDSERDSIRVHCTGTNTPVRDGPLRLVHVGGSHFRLDLGFIFLHGIFADESEVYTAYKMDPILFLCRCHLVVDWTHFFHDDWWKTWVDMDLWIRDGWKNG